LAFGDECKDGNLALGIRKRRSYYEVATVEDCSIIPADFKKIALCVQDYFRKTGEAFFHRKRHTGSLRHLVLRRGEFTGEVLVNLSTASCLAVDLAPLVTQLLELELDGQIVGILHSVHDGVADTVKDEDTRVLWGRDFFYERICGLDFKVSAYSFFQTNSAGAEKLYEIINHMAAYKKSKRMTSYEMAKCMTSYDMTKRMPSCKSDITQTTPENAGKLAYDLYCGTGTIAQVLSPHFNKVIGVELNTAAIESAKANAELNGINNCEFFAGDVLAILNDKSALGEDGYSHPLDIAVVDPPRDGLHPKALAKLIALGPPRLIYVACKPSSLARDLVALTDAGYAPVQVVGMDMFPRTPHVEAVMLLCRKG